MTIRGYLNPFEIWPKIFLFQGGKVIDEVWLINYDHDYKKTTTAWNPFLLTYKI
jgi:hypothetical protein